MLLSYLLAASISAGLQSQNGVPKEVMSKLGSGVNVTRWLGYVKPDDRAYFRNYWKPADYTNLKRLGVQFVRLCLSPEVIYDAGRMKGANVPSVDMAVGDLTAHKLLVVYDLHDNGQLKLDEAGHDNSGFITFWQQAAKHYKGRYYDSLVFELLNEPIFQKNPEVWYDLQKQAVRAIRDVDPKRTIMVASTSWNGIDSFVKMEPLSARNLIYSVHCYDPFFFTHQGASWVGPVPRDFKQIPFPSSPEAVAAVLDKNPADQRGTLEGYGRERYDAAYLHKRIKMAADWGRQNGVPVVLGEFGAYPPVSPPESRARWFSTMKGALRAERMPYAIWGYDDALGLGRTVNPNGTISLDPVVVRAFYGK
jgi:aryl-phospho-beta-D-glucosidase BglC (GH1 family)